MSYTDSRGYTYTQRTTIIHHSGSPSKTSEYESRSSDPYTGSNTNSISNMSGRSSTSSSGNGYASRGSGEEKYVIYRDAAADKKYIKGKTSRSGNVHVIEHGDSHKHYDPEEPRVSEGRESDYKETSKDYERRERQRERGSGYRR